MLSPARLVTSAGILGVRPKLVPIQNVEFDESRADALLAALVDAAEPGTRMVKRRARGKRGRAAITITAVALTAVAATAAYAWWRRQESDSAGSGYPGRGLLTPVSEEPVSVAPAAMSSLPSETASPYIAQATDESAGAAKDDTEVVATSEPAPESSPVASITHERGEQDGGLVMASNESSEPSAPGGGETAPASKPGATAIRRTRPDPILAGPGAPVSARLTPRDPARPLTQPRFTVPSPRARMPGGWRTPLPK
jgi:hypothetical protein